MIRADMKAGEYLVQSAAPGAGPVWWRDSRTPAFTDSGVAIAYKFRSLRGARFVRNRCNRGLYEATGRFQIVDCDGNVVR